MTVIVSTAGPGSEDWRSTRYSATVDATSAYVYGVTKLAEFDTSVWASGDPIECAFVPFQADASAAVLVTLIGTPITSFKVYPENVGITAAIVGSDLSVTMPPNVRARVEVNGDRAQPLSIFSSPISTSAPIAKTGWTDEVKTVSAVSTGADGHWTITGHGWTGTIRLIITSTGDLPTASVGHRLRQHEAVIGVVVDANTVQIVDPLAPVQLQQWADAGTGTVSAAKASWEDTANTLHFAAGVHSIGRAFRLETDVSVYLDDGAVVIGSFDIIQSQGVDVAGPGVLSGSFAETSDVHALATFVEKTTFGMFNGFESPAVSTTWTNSVRELTILANPFHSSSAGVSVWENVHVISPWTYTTDGPNPSATTSGGTSRVVDCYTYVGDDAIHFRQTTNDVAVSGCYAVTAHNGCYHGGYNPSSSSLLGFSVTIENCHATHLGNSDTGLLGGHMGIGQVAVIKSLVDGNSGQTTYGNNNVFIDGFNVWGALANRLFVLGNVRYPFIGDGYAAEQYGQLTNWTVDNLATEVVPTQVSQIIGKDADNRPSHLTFGLLELAGTAVTESNFETYFNVSVYATGITWPGVQQAPAFVVETGAGSATANSFATVAYADQYHRDQGNPAAWATASVAAKESALRVATAYLDDVYGSRWRGTVASTTQALLWPRYGAVDGLTAKGYLSTEMPRGLKEAACELANKVVAGTALRVDLAAGATGVSSSSISIGGISINESFAGSQTTQPRFPTVDSKLRGLLGSSSPLMMRISR